MRKPLCCSKCHNKIEPQQLLEWLRPDGFVVHFKVRMKTSGEVGYVKETQINPQTMEVLPEDYQIPECDYIPLLH